MSYQLGLDEMTEETIWGEITFRQEARERGVCDYCQRRPSTQPCQMRTRHSDPRIRPTDPCTECGGSGQRANPEPGGRTYCEPCQGKGTNVKHVRH